MRAIDKPSLQTSNSARDCWLTDLDDTRDEFFSSLAFPIRWLEHKKIRRILEAISQLVLHPCSDCFSNIRFLLGLASRDVFVWFFLPMVLEPHSCAESSETSLASVRHNDFAEYFWFGPDGAASQAFTPTPRANHQLSAKPRQNGVLRARHRLHEESSKTRQRMLQHRDAGAVACFASAGYAFAYATVEEPLCHVNFV